MLFNLLIFQIDQLCPQKNMHSSPTTFLLFIIVIIFINQQQLLKKSHLIFY
jgi:hypothetical protein